MTTKLRIAIGAAAGVAGLALAAPALATFTPRLAISHNTAATAGARPTTIHVTIPQSDDPVAQLNIFVPTGYTIAASTPGTQIGQASASVFSRDTGLTLPLEGPVTAADPAQFTGPPNNLCVPGQHFAVWLLALTVAGQNVTVPVYVDPTTGSPFSTLGAYKITTCFAPPDVPQGTPGRSPQGAQLLDANFTVNAAVTLPSASGSYVWRMLSTPYTPGTGAPNVAGTVESRSFLGLPGTVTLSARYVVKTNTYRLTGRVSAGGTGVGGVRAQIFRGRTVAGLARVANTLTKANGTYATAGHLRPKKTTYFQVRVTVPEQDDASGCTAANVPPAGNPAPPCVSSTLGGWAGRSAIVRIRL
jgi:hypothetical protein